MKNYKSINVTVQIPSGGWGVVVLLVGVIDGGVSCSVVVGCVEVEVVVPSFSGGLVPPTHSGTF